MKLTITILKEISYSLIVAGLMVAFIFFGAIAAAFYYSLVNYKF